MMKVLKYVALGFVVFTSCTKDKSLIQQKQHYFTDTIYKSTIAATPQHPKVLIEEHTGVRCVNCPDGHIISDAIEANHPDSVLVVGFHTYPSPAYFFASEDLYNLEADEHGNYCGGVGGWPSAAINRININGAVLHFKETWDSIANIQLQNNPPLTILLSKRWNIINNNFDVSVRVEALQNINDSLAISAYVIEDSIIQPQNTPSGIDTFYSHKNVMRKLITKPYGVAIPQLLNKHDVCEKVFQVATQANWNINKCSLVVLVQKKHNSKEVMHSNLIALN